MRRTTLSDLVPGVAASLLVNGQIFSQTNLGGDGLPDLHPAVRDFFDALPTENREYFVGHCAESALVSDQLWGLDRQRPDGGTTTLDEAASHFTGVPSSRRRFAARATPITAPRLRYAVPARRCSSGSASTSSAHDTRRGCTGIRRVAPRP